MLEDAVVPKMIEIIENSAEDFNPQDGGFQQDGAPPHFALPVRAYLDAEFPGHWIGRRILVEWPSRSPDMSPLDSFLWGHVKSKAFATTPRDLEELKQRITEECRLITPHMLRYVREEFVNRLFFCQAKNGEQFEQDL
ncbi:unnamed protein product [Bemisia tabaci]|uniref:Transposable element Tc3 transposase n=1 Tax=Bemisia tabaci TaxID=7038 RepID=A0A9P0A0D9_BEMTA|nr:unnamed protein product [Bemisia tabaci]